jgi:hypothetical protein
LFARRADLFIGKVDFFARRVDCSAGGVDLLVRRVDLIATKGDLLVRKVDLVVRAFDLFVTRVDLNRSKLDLSVRNVDLIAAKHDLFASDLDLFVRKLDLSVRNRPGDEGGPFSSIVAHPCSASTTTACDTGPAARDLARAERAEVTRDRDLRHPLASRQRQPFSPETARSGSRGKWQQPACTRAKSSYTPRPSNREPSHGPTM